MTGQHLVMMLTRRDFVQSAAAGAAAALLGCAPNAVPPETVPATSPAMPDLAYATLRTRPGRRNENVKRGLQRLGMGAPRDGFLYVPPSYSPDRALPLLVLLHGAGSDANDWLSIPLASVADDPPMILLAPDSRDKRWDVSLGGFGQDVRFIDDALGLTFGMCNVDLRHLGLGGFSDGASYTLSLGLTNGDLFTHLMAFSPGYMKPATRRGKPRIFIAHGREDKVLPVETTRNVIVSMLRKDGYDVRYDEFEGPHALKMDELARALKWFVPRDGPSVKAEPSSFKDLTG